MIRVGILVKSPVISQYMHDLISRIKNDANIELDTLFICGSPEPLNTWQTFYNWLFRLILFIEKMFLSANKNITCQIVSSRDLRLLFSKTVLLDLQNTAQDSRRIVQELQPDLLIKISDNIDHIEVLSDIPSMGLISAEFSDDTRNENLMAGFWEVFYRQDITSFSISRILQDKTKEVLLECNFQTRYCFLLNRAFLYKKSGIHFYDFIQSTATEGKFPSHRGSPKKLTKSRLLYSVSGLTFVKYVLMTSAIILTKIFRTVFYSGFRWHVVVYNKYFNNSFSIEPRIILNPDKRFLADPFLFSFKDRTYCFVEDCDYKTKKGRISVLEVKKDSFSEIVPCLEEKFHLSFPYVFSYKDDIYMCPETCDSGQIRLYKAVDFPHRWDLEKVLMDNIRAADTMLFESGGMWWMLTNIDPAKIGDNSSELYLFSADSPLSDTWAPHHLNPIYIDSTKARNGGLIVTPTGIYRVAQRQAFDKYGANVSLYKVSEISTENYSEELVQTIEANYLPEMLGTHHMSSAGTYTALDFYNVKK